MLFHPFIVDPDEQRASQVSWQILRERLGEQLEIASSETLRQRVDTLTEANSCYGDENRQLRAELAQLLQRLLTTENDLAAARTSIRRMIRTQTDDIAGTPQS
jgi:hypothetical protein